MTRRSGALALGMILGVGGILRFQGLGERGLAYYDEGSLAQVAKGPAIAARWTVRSVIEGAPLTAAALREEYVRHGFPYPYAAAKHGYAAIVSAGMAVFGVRDVVPLAVSAVFGTLSLVWAWRIGALLGGIRAGAIAAALLAVSPNHLFYSRSGFAHATGVFFALWTFHRYLSRLPRPGGGGMFRTGLLAGAAFLCHYTLFWIVPLVLGCQAWRILFRPADRRASWNRAAALLAGFSLPLLACEGGMQALKRACAGWLPEVSGYLAEVLYAFDLVESIFGRMQASLWFYPCYTVRTEGIAYAFLALVGISVAIRSGKKGALLAAGILVVYLWYALAPFAAGRTLLVTFPLGWILAAAALRGSGKGFPWLAGGAFAAHLAFAAPLLGEIVKGRSPYPAIVAEANRDGKRLAAVDDYPVVEFYQGGGPSPFVRTEGDLDTFRAAVPVRFLAVNRAGRYGFDDPVWSAEGRYEAVRRIVGALRPSRETPFGFPACFDDAFAEEGSPVYRVEAYDIEPSGR